MALHTVSLDELTIDDESAVKHVALHCGYEVLGRVL